MVIFPLAPDQTIAQMWSNGARGVRPVALDLHLQAKSLNSHNTFN